VIDLQQIPAQPQRQDSVADQLADLVAIANRLGMYDAADVVRQMAKNLPELRYGCHCDLEPGDQADGCVLDDGRPQDCIYTKPGMRKEQCGFWRIVTPDPNGETGT
jgi:hypothetical protein